MSSKKEKKEKKEKKPSKKTTKKVDSKGGIKRQKDDDDDDEENDHNSSSSSKKGGKSKLPFPKVPFFVLRSFSLDLLKQLDRFEQSRIKAILQANEDVGKIAGPVFAVIGKK
jgi:hypothetical protein